MVGKRLSEARAEQLHAAQLHKLHAEKLKLEAEARELGRSVWARPATYASMLPAAAALLTAVYAWNTGLLSAQRAENAATVKEIEADAKLKKAEQVAAEIAQTARSERLAAENKLLEVNEKLLANEQSKFADESAAFSKRKEQLDAERASLLENMTALKATQDKLLETNKKIGSENLELRSKRIELENKAKELAGRVSDLDQRLKSSKLTSALEYIGDEGNFATYHKSAEFSLLLSALKNDSSQAALDKVEATFAASKRARTRLAILRVLYEATGYEDYARRLVEIGEADWTNAGTGSLYWQVFGFKPEEASPAVRSRVLSFLHEVALSVARADDFSKFEHVSRAMLGQCDFETCKDYLQAFDPIVLEQLRNWIVNRVASDAYIVMNFLDVLNLSNPKAATLLYANALKEDAYRDDLLNNYSQTYKIPDIALRPAQATLSGWNEWLKTRRSELDVVLKQPVGAWPRFAGKE